MGIPNVAQWHVFHNSRKTADWVPLYISKGTEAAALSSKFTRLNLCHLNAAENALQSRKLSTALPDLQAWWFEERPVCVLQPGSLGTWLALLGHWGDLNGFTRRSSDLKFPICLRLPLLSSFIG